MPGLYNYWWCITSFESTLKQKETHLFYESNVIIFSIDLELLWKPTLLIRYKLNIFWYPRVNQFDIFALFVRSLRQVHTVRLKWYFMVDENLPSGSSLMSEIAWHYFCCVMNSYCIHFNYPLGIILIPLRCYTCFYYRLSCSNNIIFLTPKYLRQHLTELSCNVNS